MSETPRRGTLGLMLKEIINMAWSLWAWKQMLLLMVALGFALIAFRAAVISMLPWLAHHYRVMVIAINYIILTFDVMQVAIDALVDAIKIVMLVFTGGREPKHIATNFKGIPFVDGREVHDELIDVARTCTGHTNGIDIMEFISKDALNPYVCPVVRSLQPTVFAHVAKAPTTWLTYNVDPNVGAQGCVSPRDDTSTEWICVGLGTGYIILEIILPLVLGTLLLYHVVKFAVAVYHKKKK